MSAHATGLRLAATTILVRERRGALEALMMQRPAKGSFANAWVFPGGAVDPGDYATDALPDEREELAARTAASREMREESGLRIRAEELTPYAMWSPPLHHEPLFRTWFFVATEHDGDLDPHPDEALALEWVRPAQMLRAHARDEVTLVVPTWVTLHQLADVARAEELVERAAVGPFEHFETREPEAGVFCWFGDSSFDEMSFAGAVPPICGVHRLDTTRRPWTYTRACEVARAS